MSVQEVKNPEDSFLKKFITGRDMPRLKDPEETKTFRDLQRYDLICVGPRGKFRITSMGKYALGVGVKRYIANARLEKKLVMDYVKNRSLGTWLFSFGILFFLFFISIVLFYSEDIKDLL